MQPINDEHGKGSYHNDFDVTMLLMITSDDSDVKMKI